jgi:BirA family transcriptional regulator, biotin operon repressor / biotin---[acetyl-CoA-carboxylase] ligase
MGIAPVIHLDSVDSTMDELAAMLARRHVEPWTAVIADFQRKGRGRAGRSWVAPHGSALLTSIYAPAAIDATRIGMLAIAAGLAVSDALADFGVRAALKWPNDILVNDRKLAGVLISTQIGEKMDVSVGIGLNIGAAPPGAIAMAELDPGPPSATALLGAIRLAMIARWWDLEVGSFDFISARWNEIAAWAGQRVSVPETHGMAGRLIGIDEWGHLRLETADGEILLTESEIARGPVPSAAAPYTSH